MIETYISRKERKEGRVDLRTWIVSEDDNHAIRYNLSNDVRIRNFRYLSLYDGLIYQPEITSTDGGDYVYDAASPGGGYWEGGVYAQYICPCCDEVIAVDLDSGEVWTGELQSVWIDDQRWDAHEHHGVLLSVDATIMKDHQRHNISANYIRSNQC